MHVTKELANDKLGNNGQSACSCAIRRVRRTIGGRRLSDQWRSGGCHAENSPIVGTVSRRNTKEYEGE